jgi:RHS repeat-associated protein
MTTYTYKQGDGSDGQYTTTAKQAGGKWQTIYLYDKAHELIEETSSEGECNVVRKSKFEGGVKKTTMAFNAVGSRKVEYTADMQGGALNYRTMPAGSRGYAYCSVSVGTDWDWLSRAQSYALGEEGFSVYSDAGDENISSRVHDLGGSKGLIVETVLAASTLSNEFSVMKFSVSDGGDKRQPLERVVRMNFAGGKSATILERWERSSEQGEVTTDFFRYFQVAEGTPKLFSVDNHRVRVRGLQRHLITQGAEGEVEEVQSVLSGRLIAQTDANKNRTTYTYDSHGRLTTLTTCAQSDIFKQVTTYSYPSVGRLEITEPDGRQRATEDDGLGNLIAEYARDDAKKPWRQTLKVEYDNRGRKHKTIRYDYLADGTQVSEWCELTYDAWNQECQQTYSTGHQVFNQYDPVAHTRTEWAGKATDKQRMITTYNADDTVASIEWLDADGKQSQKETLTYTHAAQVHTRTVEGKGSWRRTTYTYDDAGRVLAQAHDERTAADANEKNTFTYSYEYPENWLLTEPSKISLDGQVLGEREYDDLGRVTKLSRGDVSETFMYETTGHLARSSPLIVQERGSRVPKSRTGADGVTQEFKYFPELGNQVKEITGKNAQGKVLGKQTFSYAHGANRESSASEGAQAITFDHDLNEQVTKQHAKLNDSAETTVSRTVSDLGRMLSETDAAGNVSTFSYNAKGQRSEVVSGTTTTTHEYDDRGRLDKDTITLGTNEVTVKYSYDTGGQELKRQFSLTGAFDLSIKREYSAEGRLSCITLYDGQAKQALGSHTYTYTVGGAVASCSSTGVWQPKNPKGTAISHQAFTYDNLGNVKTCVTTFGNQSCTSTYTYDVAKGYRLKKLEQSHADYKPVVTVEYDAAGRVTKDATGKTYAYDWLGRLVRAGSRHYTYDPLNRLASSADQAGGTPHQLIHDGYRVRGEYPVGTQRDHRIVLPGSSACQVQKNKAGTSERTLFNLCDDDGSVLISFDIVSRRVVHHAYSAYGEHSSTEQQALHGYNGEYREAEGDQYPLGRGYRWYAPQIMQFQAQDGASPFDRGGPNAYGYCDGDPVNHTDPSGQWKRRREHWDISACEPAPAGFGRDGAIIAAVIFGAITVISAVMTGGTSLIVTAALVALAVVSAATAIAGALVEESDPKAAKILGWVSLGVGVAGGAAQLGKKLAQITVQLSRSGRQVARQLLQKSASVMRSLRQGPARLPKSVPKPPSGALRGIAKESLGELRIGELNNFKPNMRTDYTGAFKNIANADSPWTVIYQDLTEGTLMSAIRRLGAEDASTVMNLVVGVLGASEAGGDGAGEAVVSWAGSSSELPWGHWRALFKLR